MSDRYLFRGKRKDNGEWVEGIYLFIRGRTFILLNSSGYSRTAFMDEDIFEVIPETVGQWTGLKDKGGKKIFEGDILRGFSYPFLSDGDENYYAVVAWCSDACGFFSYPVRCSDRVSGRACADYVFEDGKHSSEKFEIIGNTTDNPELLEGA